MKTFKLNMLEIVEVGDDIYKTIQIPLHDGLIINQEDDKDTWMIEAYTDDDFLEYFSNIQEKDRTLIVHVKITTDLNEKATCLSKIVDLNKIDDKLSVLLIGPMLKERTENLEKKISELLTEGYRGENLVGRFEETI